MQHDVLVLAYLAGIIDGDGYITIHRSVRNGRAYHAPQIGIAGTRREPHDLAASLWGGRVGCYSPKISGHLPQFQWSRQGASAATAINDLFPFLRVKREQAVLALELADHVDAGKWDDPYPWFGPHYSPVERSDDLRREMIAMNLSRSRLRKSGRWLDGREHNDVPAVTP